MPGAATEGEGEEKDSRRDWYIHDAANDAALRRVIIERCRVEGTYRNFYARIAGVDEADFSRWLDWSRENAPPSEDRPRKRRGSDILRDDRYYQLIRYGIANGWFQGNHVLLQRGLAIFLGQLPGQRPKTVLLDGFYKTYRYSFLAPGFVLVGEMYINSKTLETTERHRIQSGVSDRQTDAWFLRNGILRRRGENSFMVLSTKVLSAVEVQMRYFETYGEVAAELRGRIADWHGGQFYSVNFVAYKTGRPLRDSEIVALPQHSISPSIRVLLEAVHIQSHVALLA